MFIFLFSIFCFVISYQSAMSASVEPTTVLYNWFVALSILAFIMGTGSLFLALGFGSEDDEAENED